MKTCAAETAADWCVHGGQLLDRRREGAPYVQAPIGQSKAS